MSLRRPFRSRSSPPSSPIPNHFRVFCAFCAFAVQPLSQMNEILSFSCRAHEGRLRTSA
jgi:hypothetical protein